MKRIIDIFFSLIIIIIFLPFGITISIILKFTGEGEIFYLQPRIGMKGKSFGIYKFVTMVKNSPNIGAKDITLKEDPRVLPFGKILRKLKLNEFPQFINVLLGNMSLVGPRPLVRNQFEMIPSREPNDYQSKIKKMKPGITGIGSIIFRDEEKFFKGDKNKSQIFYKEEIVPFKSKLECWYYDNQSIVIDLILIFLTVVSVISINSKLHNLFFKNLPKHKIFNP